MNKNGNKLNDTVEKYEDPTEPVGVTDWCILQSQPEYNAAQKKPFSIFKKSIKNLKNTLRLK